MQLELLGHDCEVVSSGEAALELLQSMRYHAALVDVRLPGMSGIATAQAIRALEVAEERPRMPIIALSAVGGSATEADCKLAGMDQFLAKPIGVAQLAAALGSAITH